MLVEISLFEEISFYNLFIHSFILDTSIASLQVHYYSEALPTTALILCVGVGTPKRYRQLQVKDLPKVPTWWPERDSNQRFSGRKAPNLPLSHDTPQMPVMEAQQKFDRSFS